MGDTPVSEQFPGAVPGSYVVSAGDTLRGIALSLFGDAQLWYLIADANGLKSDADLQIGRNLTVPNKVTNLRNASDTFKPYAPGRIIGDTTPTLPDPPPPPARSGGGGGGCGGVGAFIVAAVAIVATVFTAGALAPAAVSAATAATGATGLAATWASGMAVLGGASFAAGGFAAAMIGGAVGSIASQSVGMALGMQDKFSWSGVAMGAIGGGVSAGLGAAGMGIIGRAVVGSVITQGIGVATGMQKEFSWSSVAAAGVGAGVGQAVGSIDFGGNAFARDLTVGLASGAARQVVSGGKANWANVAADAFGNALGNAIGEAMSPPSPAPFAPGYGGGDLGNGLRAKPGEGIQPFFLSEYDNSYRSPSNWLGASENLPRLAMQVGESGGNGGLTPSDGRYIAADEAMRAEQTRNPSIASSARKFSDTVPVAIGERIERVFGLPSGSVRPVFSVGAFGVRDALHEHIADRSALAAGIDKSKWADIRAGAIWPDMEGVRNFV